MPSTVSLDLQYQTLKAYFSSHLYEGICLAYSGGVDSTLLLKAAVDAAADGRSSSQEHSAVLPVLAVILETQLHPHSDIEQAFAQAASLGAKPTVIQVDEFQNKELLHNPANRCYLCKHMLFSQLIEYAVSQGYHFLCDGTNKDDEKEYRPGMRVLTELQIHSPLLALGITKSEVRQLSAMLGLSTASVPSTPCLATRLPYGAELDPALLQRIHRGEQWLRSQGFYNVRLRYHAPLLRLEIDCCDFPKLLEQRSEVIAQLKALDFPYITLDLEGFRSGSMDFLLS